MAGHGWASLLDFSNNGDSCEGACHCDDGWDVEQDCSVPEPCDDAILCNGKGYALLCSTRLYNLFYCVVLYMLTYAC